MSIVATMLVNITKVVATGLILGAGLPALFAFGMRLRAGTTEFRADGSLVQTAPAGAVARALSYVCFALVLIAVVVGILWITQGFIHQHTGIDLFGSTK